MLKYKIKFKKGQLKIQQMAIMLLAITLFFVLVGMVVLTVSVGGLRERANLLEGENAMLLASRIANSPEFSCGGSFGTGKTSCIDFDKVMVLSNVIDKYENFWGVSEIEIRKVYPKRNNQECNLGNYPDCDVVKVFSKNGEEGIGVSNFISLCSKQSSEEGVYDKCEVAKIIISYKEDD